MQENLEKRSARTEKPGASKNTPDVDRIIEMAWEDRTPFDAIKRLFSLNEGEVITIMRQNLKRSSFNRWRARVSGRSTKHEKLRHPSIERHKCPTQNKIKNRWDVSNLWPTIKDQENFFRVQNTFGQSHGPPSFHYLADWNSFFRASDTRRRDSSRAVTRRGCSDGSSPEAQKRQIRYKYLFFLPAKSLWQCAYRLERKT